MTRAEDVPRAKLEERLRFEALPADTERTQILAALEQTGWRIRGADGAATLLGLKPTTLESRIKKLGLQRPR